jgi:hypothetical protein
VRARPLSLLAALGTAAHHGFELRAGIGLVFEPFLGRRRTKAMWLVALPFWMWRALRPAPRDEPLLALNAGVAIAGSAVHFVEWPWSLRWGVVPWLDEAEGLPPSKLPAYNTILWLWMVGGVGSALLETRRADRKWVAAGVATAPALLASARHHFRWAREQAQQDPASWSPRLLDDEAS